MNLIKFPLVTTDDFVINSEIILDASKLVEMNVVAATLVCTFAAGSANSILTFTFDGTTANRLASATAMMNRLSEDIQTLAGPTGTSRGVFDFCPETKDAAGMIAFEARCGLVIDGTAAAGEGLVSIALT